MKKLSLLIILVFLVSFAAAHSGEHSNETAQEGYGSQSSDVFSQLSAEYPPSVIILVSAEIVIAAVLTGWALLHYRKRG